MRSRVWAGVCALSVLVVLLSGCGGGGGGAVFVSGGPYSPYVYGPVIVVPNLVGLTVLPANPTVNAGTTVQFALVGAYSDGTTANLTLQGGWTSSTLPVLTISPQTGLAYAASAGTAIVTASVGGLSASTTVTVVPPALQSITLSPTRATLAAGTAVQLTATGTFTNGTTADVTSSVTWSSGTTAVATVSNSSTTQGRVVGVSPGSAVITASSAQGVSASVNVTVTGATLATLSISPGSATIANLTALPFTASGTFSDGTSQDLTASVTWASSNLNVATIGNSLGTYGLATASAAGGTTITASLLGQTATSTLTVTNATVVSIGVSPANTQIARLSSQPYTATATFSDGTTQDVTRSATWSISNPLVATVSNTPGTQGVVNGVADGVATVTASLSSVIRTTGLTVIGP